MKKNGGWQARWYDETDTRQSKAGFATKTAGREWLDDKVKEVAALRRGDPTIVRRQTIPTYNELCDEYLAQHHGQANTLRGLKLWLASSRRKWGTMRIDRITADVALWRRTQPERSAWHYHRGLKQVLGYAVRTKLLDENVAEHVPNPQPRVREVQVFDLAEIEAIAAELAPMFRAIPMFAAFTGLRPEEWIPLERNDVDRRAMTVRVRRVYTDGVLKDTGKTAGSLRTVPLPRAALTALDAVTARLDTPLLFPGRDRGLLNLSNWRNLDWKPACWAADVTYRSPYALRHTYASMAIAAGVNLHDLARLMGTSLQQIDKTYGHLLPDSLDRARTALDGFAMTAAERMGTEGAL